MLGSERLRTSWDTAGTPLSVVETRSNGANSQLASRLHYLSQLVELGMLGSPRRSTCDDKLESCVPLALR